MTNCLLIQRESVTTHRIRETSTKESVGYILEGVIRGNGALVDKAMKEARQHREDPRRV